MDLGTIHCREFLRAVRKAGHLIVMSEPISAEWDVHQSLFALAIRLWMSQHRRVYYVGDPTDDALRQEITRAATGDGERQIMLKDAHLIEAAIVADRTVSSLDERVRGHFRRAAMSVEQLRTIVWVNPHTEADVSLTWINGGARPDKHRQFGFQVRDQHRGHQEGPRHRGKVP